MNTEYIMNTEYLMNEILWNYQYDTTKEEVEWMLQDIQDAPLPEEEKERLLALWEGLYS